MRSFSVTVMLQPGACSPSRRVVSKMWTRSGSGRHAGRRHGLNLGSRELISQIYNYSWFDKRSLCSTMPADGAPRPAGLRHRRRRAQLLARRREAVPHPARHLAGGPAARERARREADRPRRQGAGPDRHRPHRARLRPPLPQPRGGAGRRAGRAARQVGRPPGRRRQRVVDALPAAAHRALPRPSTPRSRCRSGAASRAASPSSSCEGDLELGVASYDPGDDRLVAKVIYTDALAFIVSPKHRLARRRAVSITELGKETFIAHNVAVALPRGRAARVPPPQGAAATWTSRCRRWRRSAAWSRTTRASPSCRACASGRTSRAASCAR